MAERDMDLATLATVISVLPWEAYGMDVKQVKIMHVWLWVNIRLATGR